MREALGAQIKHYRKLRKLSQDALASAMGVHKHTVWGWEDGRSWPEYDKLMALSQHLGIQPEQLFETIGKTPAKPSVKEALSVLGEFVETALKGSEHTKQRQNPNAGKEAEKPQGGGITTPSAPNLHDQRTAKTENAKVRKVKPETIDDLRHIPSSEHSNQTLEASHADDLARAQARIAELERKLALIEEADREIADTEEFLKDRPRPRRK